MSDETEMIVAYVAILGLIVLLIKTAPLWVEMLTNLAIWILQ
jgi:hypothetical protein